MTAQAAPADARQPGTYQWLTRYPKGVDWHQKLTPAPLYQLLDDAVAKFGSRPCTNFLGKVLTYREIAAMVDRAAAGLQKLGVKKGTKVGLFMPNCPTFIVYYFATLKAGGTVVNYNPLYTLEELTFQVKDSETELMVTLDLKLLFDKVEGLMKAGTLKRAIVASFPALLPGAKSVLYKLFKGKDLAHPTKSPVAANIIADADVRKNDGKYQKQAIDPLNDVAVLQYTGGTTGTPKGAMLTHANVNTNCQQGAAWATNLVPGKERVLAALPFFHVFAMTAVMNFAVANGAEIVIMPRFVLDDAMKLIDKNKPTVMPGVPTMFIAMLNHPKLASFDLSSLKFCLSGGAPLPVDVKQKFEKLTGCKLVEGYGLSEASPSVTCNPLDGPVKEGSIGQPLPGTIVSLRDLADPTKEAPQGEKGEICIKGPQVMKGYWKKPEETANQFAGDYLRTGDVGIMDEEGFIFIVDRIKDLIICSGYNVYPRRIEEAIYEHPAVEEVTVIGINDGYRGEAPKAFIKLRAGAKATEDDIRKHLEPKISKIEMPAEIEFRDALPKTMIGKLSKKELKAEEEQRRKAKAK
ncbi:MAG: long-chain fatty acid--CoA ligase [Alphaproteobacteria bacterium]|jgi:long-chain acyl-CoA synthetase|nr:MAG: long-chain fatty acid--CoA ligase [Alphaproteobacteria bacterium]